MSIDNTRISYQDNNKITQNSPVVKKAIKNNQQLAEMNIKITSSSFDNVKKSFKPHRVNEPISQNAIQAKKKFVIDTKENETLKDKTFLNILTSPSNTNTTTNTSGTQETVSIDYSKFRNVITKELKAREIAQNNYYYDIEKNVLWVKKCCFD